MPKKRHIKNYTKETFKNNDSWLGARGIGGSSASSILNSNKWQSKMDLYMAWTYPEKKSDDKSKSEMFEYGHKCEELMRKLFALDFPQYKVHTPRNYEMYRDKDRPYLTATVDGLLEDKITHAKGIWECKTHDIRNKADEEEWDNGIPQNYYIQCLHYLLVLKDCEFVILNAKLRYFDYFSEDGKKIKYQKIVYYFIYRKDVEKEIDYLGRKEEEFYNDYKNKKWPKVYISF